MKLISITWSYEQEFKYKDTTLYKSFIKNNIDNDFKQVVWVCKIKE
jgi:hypothetical protein